MFAGLAPHFGGEARTGDAVEDAGDGTRREGLVAVVEHQIADVGANVRLLRALSGRVHHHRSDGLFEVVVDETAQFVAFARIDRLAARRGLRV